MENTEAAMVLESEVDSHVGFEPTSIWFLLRAFPDLALRIVVTLATEMLSVKYAIAVEANG